MTSERTALAPPDWVAGQEPSRWLTPTELDIWWSFRAEKRRAGWLAGRLAVKRLAREFLEIEPQSCEVGSDGIAPQLWDRVSRRPFPRINLTLSHSDGFGAASWAETATEGTVGLDIQRLRPVHPKLAVRILTSREQAQWSALFAADPAGILLFWALKEAAIKARRRPWARALRAIEVSVESGEKQSGTARIGIGEETPLCAAFERVGDWWLARALRSPVRS